MSLLLNVLSSSPMGNNVVLVHDAATHRAILIDPSFDPDEVLEYVQDNSLIIESILFTHGHFDHFAGLAFLLANLTPAPKVGLHKGDLSLWRSGGGSVHFRIPIDLPADPDFYLDDELVIDLGGEKIMVRHTPGHSPGSVIFFIPSLKTAIVGDLIFKQGIGRTDLDGGSFNTLKKSIDDQVFTLPPDTTLIPGHGPMTTVASEMQLNPYVGLSAGFY